MTICYVFNKVFILLTLWRLFGIVTVIGTGILEVSWISMRFLILSTICHYIVFLIIWLCSWCWWVLQHLFSFLSAMTLLLIRDKSSFSSTMMNIEVFPYHLHNRQNVLFDQPDIILHACSASLLYKHSFKILEDQQLIMYSMY